MKTDSSTAIKIKDLHYKYKSDWLGKPFHALKGINLEVFEGESFGFLGHNGAGKTTTIKLLLGLTTITSGSIKIFGKDPKDPSARRSVGYLPEQPYFYDHLTVQEIMDMYATLAGIKKDFRQSAIKEALEMVKVSARAKSPMRSLSKGLTQRVAMAQAIVGSPKLLILDEPFSGLDPIGRREFADLMVELKKRGTTIFMSSHILSDVEFLCDRASIMAYGELKGVYQLRDIPQMSSGSYELIIREFDGDLRDIKSKAAECVIQEKLIRLTFTDRKTAEQVLTEALAMGIAIESFRFQQGTLEDLFVELVKFEEAKHQ
ncbi:MAG: ABC transporter ATP-binding protein [Candidatus Dadabacteria bacterium]|nr:MAG: ABC transporter ATP-binding protein [Candidatus Dadabacteria bacterium]